MQLPQARVNVATVHGNGAVQRHTITHILTHTHTHTHTHTSHTHTHTHLTNTSHTHTYTNSSERRKVVLTFQREIEKEIDIES